MKFTTIYDEHEIEIIEKKKEFESNIDAQRTIDICRQLCCEDEPIDDESRNSRLCYKVSRAKPLKNCTEIRMLLLLRIYV